MDSTKRTAYQDKIIKRYYENRDGIMEDKISDLMAELYLASGAKRTRLWKRVSLALNNLGIKQTDIDNVVLQDKPELLVKYIGRK